jgi:hypothetical protein
MPQKKRKTEMYEFVAFCFETHGRWVKDLLNPTFCEDTKGIVALKNNKPIGVMLADQWTDSSVQTHIGITDPLCLKHGLHKEFCKWVFITAGRKMMIGLTPSNNEKAMKLNKHFGFTEVGRLKDAYADGVDYVQYVMKREDCKYIPQELRKAA